MKLEVGKYYKTRDGLKVGPMKYEWDRYQTPDGHIHYNEDGTCFYRDRSPHDDLISEWPSDGPVRTVTRKEIVPGVYGVVSVHNYMPDDSTLYVALVNNISHKEQVIHASVDATELRAAAATLIEIADALEDGKDE